MIFDDGRQMLRLTVIDTGLPVALLDTRPYAKPEDDVDDGQYVSLLQLHLDGYILSRTGRRTDEDE